MNRFLIKYLFLLGFLIVVSGALSSLKAQTDSTTLLRLSQFVRNIQTFNRLNPQEKVYLHFDNTAYALGETIWFKSYLVTAERHLPMPLSGVLYVELLNEKGKILETKKIKIEEGEGYGEFYLNPINMEYFPGFYEVRAYTRAMLNFGDEVVFSRVFPVFNEVKLNGDYTEEDLRSRVDINLKDYREKASKKKEVNIDLFPEGGNLVEGIASKVAFKVTGKDGRPLKQIKGEVVNTQGEIITTFSIIHNGMGVFDYIPDGRKNKVRVSYMDNVYEFDFPKSLSKGYVLTVNNSSSQTLTIRVDKSRNIPSSTLGVVILSQGEVSFFESLNINESSFLLTIPKDRLLSGVNQITLFDRKGEVFAERLFFVYPKDEEFAFIEAFTDKEEYEPLEKINVDFSINKKNLRFNTGFSLAVRDSGNEIQTNNTDNIASYFLLSSDLKGFIEDPGFYFKTTESSREVALDILMLVQGWRRYEWSYIAGLKPFKKEHVTEKTLTIEGFLASSSGKKAEVKIRMNNKDGLYMEESTFTDENKRFYFFPEDYYGAWDMALRSSGIEEAAKNIRLNRWFSPPPKKYFPSELVWHNRVLDEQKIDSFSQRIGEKEDSISLLLSEVNVNTKRGKDLIYNVREEVDRMIDTGKKVPYSVHDYLSHNNKNYSYEWISYFIDEEAGKYASDKETIYPSLINETGSEASNTGVSGRWNIQSFNDMETTKKIDEAGGFDDNNIVLRKPDYKSKYTDENQLSDPFEKDDGMYFYEKPVQAVFFHLSDNKWKTNSSERLRTGSRDYDVVNHELTSKRVLKEVEKITISGIRKRDRYGTAFVPIYIYPTSNYGMRVLLETRYTTFDGFSKPKEFYHSEAGSNETELPDNYDYQRTLYWNPNVKINQEGKAQVSFYNNLKTRRVSISAEGLNHDGTFIFGK